MRLIRSLVLYAGLALMGNPAGADVGRLVALAEDPRVDGRKLRLAPTCLASKRRQDLARTTCSNGIS